MSANPPTWSRSLIPDGDSNSDAENKDLTASDVSDIFDDEHALIRKTVSIAIGQYDYETEVNGRSTKVEMLEWLAEECTRSGLLTLKNEAEKQRENDQ